MDWWIDGFVDRIPYKGGENANCAAQRGYFLKNPRKSLVVNEMFLCFREDFRRRRGECAVLISLVVVDGVAAFIGQAEGSWRSAVTYSIIVSCQCRAIEPWDYLRDVLRRLPAMKQSEVLLSGNWKPVYSFSIFPAPVHD
jgi:hypothetical protein